MHAMAGRELESVERAVKRYLAGETVRAAAAAEGISQATLNRGLNRRGVEKRGSPTGPAHHAWVDGRTALNAQRQAARPAPAGKR